MAGDACESDQDCEPASQGSSYPEPDDPEKTLVCDDTRGVCVDERTPDYASWCGLTDVEPRDDWRTAFLDAPDCAEGSCFLKFPDNEQICQGCTLSCGDDGDCPAGSDCIPVTDLTTIEAAPAQQRRAHICVPSSVEFLDCR